MTYCVAKRYMYSKTDNSKEMITWTIQILGDSSSIKLIEQELPPKSCFWNLPSCLKDDPIQCFGP